jgi:hypothetical protein
MQKRDDRKSIREFRVRQSRQFLAIAVTLLLLILLTFLHKRHDLFGEISKVAVSIAQLVVIAAFIRFSVFNWRCPECKKYLGHNIGREKCRRCGTRLQ